LHEYGLDLESFNYMLSYMVEPRCTWTQIPLMIKALGRQTRIFRAANARVGTFYDELVDNENIGRETGVRQGIPAGARGMNCTTVVCIFGRRGNIRACHTTLIGVRKLPVTKDGSGSDSRHFANGLVR